VEQFSPDDRYLVGWQRFNRYGSLEVAYSEECRQLYVPRDGSFVSSPEFSPDGRILAACSDAKARFWETCLRQGNQLISPKIV
jgi:WD40 repeat protein